MAVRRRSLDIITMDLIPSPSAAALSLTSRSELRRRYLAIALCLGCGDSAADRGHPHSQRRGLVPLGLLLDLAGDARRGCAGRVVRAAPPEVTAHAIGSASGRSLAFAGLERGDRQSQPLFRQLDDPVLPALPAASDALSGGRRLLPAARSRRPGDRTDVRVRPARRVRRRVAGDPATLDDPHADVGGQPRATAARRVSAGGRLARGSRSPCWSPSARCSCGKSRSSCATASPTPKLPDAPVQSWNAGRRPRASPSSTTSSSSTRGWHSAGAWGPRRRHSFPRASTGSSRTARRARRSPASTAIPASCNYLLHDVTSVGYQLRPPATAAIVGAGGGSDVLTALASNARKVTAIELNAGIIDVLRDALRRIYGQVVRPPRVQTIVGEGRSVLTRTRGKLRLDPDLADRQLGGHQRGRVLAVGKQPVHRRSVPAVLLALHRSRTGIHQPLDGGRNGTRGTAAACS